MALASLTASAQSTVKAPAPILPLPEQKQIDWQRMEYKICIALSYFC